MAFTRSICLPILITFFLALPAADHAIAQQADTAWNQTDGMGRKQGFWKKYDQDGGLIYRGFFKDGRPSGIMTRYHPDGSKKAVLHYREGGAVVYAKLYFENGRLGAEGRYTGRMKDSTWTYHSDYNGKMVLQEQYVNGRREGTSTKYYPGGQVAEKIEWQNGHRHGQWLQYYESSAIRLKASYVNGRLEGPYTVYTNEGDPSLKGQYKSGRMDGVWEFYTEQGVLDKTLEYDDGVLLNEEVLEEWVSNFMQTIDENTGAIPEVDLDNFFNKSP